MKLLISQFLLILWLTACVSASPHLIASHESDHSFTPLSHNCETTDILQRSDIMATQNNGLNTNAITLLNWNVYKGAKENWETDFKSLSHAKDIITLQEARLDQSLHEILDSLNFYWDLTTAFLYKNSKVGVLTAARVAPINQCSIHIDEPIIQLPKTLMISLYPLLGSNHQLLVANIHSINFTFGTDKYKEQLLALQDVIQQHDGPIIVAGDFNSWSDSRMKIVTQFKLELSLSSFTL